MSEIKNLNSVVFNSIIGFVNELASIFDSYHNPLKLYNHLINKTPASQGEIIKKHVAIFKIFCTKNKEAILTKNKNKLNEPIIKYSNKVYINMQVIFKKSDQENSDVIWKHLLCILTLFGDADAKNLLKNPTPSVSLPSVSLPPSTTGNEKEFIESLASRIEETIDPNISNPMEAVTAIMNSGLFTELVGNMQNGVENGNIDLTKLFGAMQGMVSNMGQPTNPETANMSNMLNMMMGSLGNNLQSLDSKKN